SSGATPRRRFRPPRESRRVGTVRHRSSAPRRAPRFCETRWRLPPGSSRSPAGASRSRTSGSGRCIDCKRGRYKKTAAGFSRADSAKPEAGRGPRCSCDCLAKELTFFLGAAKLGDPPLKRLDRFLPPVACPVESAGRVLRPLRQEPAHYVGRELLRVHPLTD